MQRSCEKCLMYISNTKYFHASVVAKRAKSKVLHLNDSSDQWIKKVEQLKGMAKDYYQWLYNEEPFFLSRRRNVGLPCTRKSRQKAAIQVCIGIGGQDSHFSNG